MLPKGAILGAVVICIVAFYCKLWNIQLFKDEQLLLQQLQLQSKLQTDEPVIRFVGRSFFYISTAAWMVLSLQSFVVAVQRAMYKPKVLKALQPLAEETRQQMQEQVDDTSSTRSQSDTGTPTGATEGTPSLTQSTHTTTAAPAPAASAVRPPYRTRQQEEDWRRERRMKALEAAQRALDEQAAAQQAIKEQEEAQRQARRKQAAEAAARQKAEKEAAQAAARAEATSRAAAAAAEEARRRALWDQAVRDQWHGLPPPTLPDDTPGLGSPPAAAASTQSGAGAPGLVSGSSASSQPSASTVQSGAQSQSVSETSGAAAAAAAAAQDRHIRQQQDEEYLLSLERDRIKAAEKAMQRKAQVAALQEQKQQQRLAALRQSLQQKLAAEPPDGDQEVLALRVRLPGGGQASRRFSVQQGLEDVFAWVYSLPEMPLWAPGSWTLISAFPRRQLAPPRGSTWAPGVWESEQGTTSQEILLPGEWMVQVNRLEDAALWVRAHQDTTLLEVQREIESQTGVAPRMQRLIFGGQILHHPHRTMKQLGITQGLVLQLAVRSSDTSNPSSDGSVDGASNSGTTEAASTGANVSSNPDGAGARVKELGKAAEHGYLGSGEELLVTTVAELQEQVAAGAPLLALYVEALQ